jgi:CRISPR-associated protein Csx17
MIHVHRLDGCAPTPLAHYLKAIGILRLVAEQADAYARAWWDGEQFFLATELDAQELLDFLLEAYSPTPLFNPWGARSGFFAGSSEKSARAALASLLLTRHPRFSDYRRIYRIICRTLEMTTGGTKPTDKQKTDLILTLRREVRGKSLGWLDAVAAVIGTGDDLDVAYPAILGTGGSEGSGSYTSAYMEALRECLVYRKWSDALPFVMFGGYPSQNCTWDKSAGHFAPTSGIAPWDLILAFEGACLVRTSVSSKHNSKGGRWASSPFFVAPTASGYGTASRLDQIVLNKSKELPGRGEQWFPLWSRPTGISELGHIFREGRAATKAGRAAEGWSLLLATKTLGVDRGIREFVRYGYQQRNNLATHFAVPLGRSVVSEHLSAKTACLNDLAGWLARLRRIARDKNTPQRFVVAERNLGHAFASAASQPDEPSRWQRLLLAVVEMESLMVMGIGFSAGPIPDLSPVWVEAAYDGRPEIRLALSLALQTGRFEGPDAPWWNSVRRHWLPLERHRPGRFAKTGSISHLQLLTGPEVVISGRSGEADAIALFQRRLVEGAQHAIRDVPLQPCFAASAHAADLAALIAGSIDLDHTLVLARALMAVDARKWRKSPTRLQPPRDPAVPDDAWLVLRLALLPRCRLAANGALHARIDPAIFRRLAGGDAATATELALRRLRAAGIRTAVRAATVPPPTARRWAAALAFPIDDRTATRLLERLDPSGIEHTLED